MSSSSLFGLDMVNDTTKTTCDLLQLGAANDDGPIEIEGKIGLLLMRNVAPVQRVDIAGVKSMVVVADNINSAFASGINADMFAHVHTKLMRQQFMFDKDRAAVEHRAPLFVRTQTNTTDRFYAVAGVKGDVRCTYDANDRLVASVTKERIRHLDYWNGGKDQCIDFRISVSRERPYTSHIDTARTPCHIRRLKQRTTYKHSLFNIDLTRVDTYVGASNDKETTYEVEVEIAEMDYVRGEARKCQRRQSNDMMKIAQLMIDNMRILSQYAMFGFPPEWGRK